MGLDATVIAIAALDFAAGAALLTNALPRWLNADHHDLITSLNAFLTLPGLMLLFSGIATLIRRPLAWWACTWFLRLTAALLVMVAAINGVIPLLVALLLGDGDGVADAATLSLLLAVPATLALLPAAGEYLLLCHPSVQAAYCGVGDEEHAMGTGAMPSRWLRRSIVHIAVYATVGFVVAMLSFQFL
jgi:hypothetical protein